MTPPRAPAARFDMQRGARATVVALALGGAALFAGAYFLPWWNFHLVAPQYPRGLELHIALTGISGDTKEIDILNHYIGMRAMSGAADFEAKMAIYLVGAVVLTVFAGLVAAGKRLHRLAMIPAIGLPIGFVADVFGWMWTFGHSLNPEATIHFEALTPTLLGKGMVGQFHTTAWPAMGFGVALLGVGFVIAAAVLRARVCNTCPYGAKCGATCPHVLVFAPEPPK